MGSVLQSSYSLRASCNDSVDRSACYRVGKLAEHSSCNDSCGPFCLLQSRYSLRSVIVGTACGASCKDSADRSACYRVGIACGASCNDSCGPFCLLQSRVGTACGASCNDSVDRSACYRVGTACGASCNDSVDRSAATE
ncbi:hypothetical protein J6590_010985 [Homalodisca vitripennis]|nr:hypothetical protein J6590_010985 [Homalodisca vitripennis]